MQRWRVQPQNVFLLLLISLSCFRLDLEEFSRLSHKSLEFWTGKLSSSLIVVLYLHRYILYADVSYMFVGRVYISVYFICMCACVCVFSVSVSVSVSSFLVVDYANVYINIKRYRIY